MFKPFLPLLVLVLSITSASSQIIVEWNYTSASGSNDFPSGLPATSFDNAILDSASNVTLGPGLAARNGGVANTVFASNGSNNAADDYWQLTLDPAASGVALTSIAFNLRTNSDPDQWIFNLYSSATGGAPTTSQQASGSLGTLTLTTTSSSPTGTLTADLTAHSEFSNLTSPVTFYLQIAANQGSGVYNEFDFFGFDSANAPQITVQGVAIPEPSTAGLMLIGAAGSLLFTRRRSGRQAHSA